MIELVEQLKLNFELICIFNYHTGGYYGRLNECDPRSFEDYEIDKTVIKDDLLEIYVHQKKE